MADRPGLTKTRRRALKERVEMLEFEGHTLSTRLEALEARVDALTPKPIQLPDTEESPR